MTARFISCRPTEMGGSPMPGAETPNLAPVTWAKAAVPFVGSVAYAIATDNVKAMWMAINYQPDGAHYGILRTLDGGDTWDYVLEPTGSNFATVGGLAWGNGLLVGTNTGLGGEVYGSTDNGTTWTALSSAAQENPENTVYGDGVWIETSGNYYSLSTDGCQSWGATEAFPSSGAANAPMLYDGTQFVGTANNGGNVNGLLFGKVGGTQWTFEQMTNASSPVYPIAFGGGKYVAAHRTQSNPPQVFIASSWDGLISASPIDVPDPLATQIDAIACTAEGRIVVLTHSGTVWWTVDDGATWVEDVADADLATIIFLAPVFVDKVLAGGTNSGGTATAIGIRNPLC